MHDKLVFVGCGRCMVLRYCVSECVENWLQLPQLSLALSNYSLTKVYVVFTKHNVNFCVALLAWGSTLEYFVMTRFICTNKWISVLIGYRGMNRPLKFRFFNSSEYAFDFGSSSINSSCHRAMSVCRGTEIFFSSVWILDSVFIVATVDLNGVISSCLLHADSVWVRAHISWILNLTSWARGYAKSAVFCVRLHSDNRFYWFYACGVS